MGRQDVDSLIGRLAKISKKIEGEEERRKPGFKFNANSKKEKLPEFTKEFNLEAIVYEDIDIKDVSNQSKFTIRIINRAGAYVDIDMFEYMDIVLDFRQSEESFIVSKIERIIGFDRDVDIDKESKKVCDYLSHACYEKELHVKRYRELGWDNYDGIRIFKYDSIYSSFGKEYEIAGECVNEVAEGLGYENCLDKDWDAWHVDFASIMNYSDIDALIISTACTGVVRQLLTYTKENNINMNIVGESASGKSTISHFALSVFGDPTILEASFTDTDNAMEKIRAERAVLPYILDERMLKVEGKSEASKRHTLLMDIFREYEGKVKERLAGQGKELSGKRTYGPIISSSVEPILDKMLEESRDLGQYRRFIELRVTAEDLFKDDAMAGRVEEMAYESYGYGVEMLVTHIIRELEDDEDYVKDTYEEINEIISLILKVMEEKHNLKGKLRSSARRFALIIITLEFLLREAVNLVSVDVKDAEDPNDVEDKNHGWISRRLDDEDIQKIKEKKKDKNKGEEKDPKWDKSYLGEGMESHFNSDILIKTKSENVLGVLIDNLIEKMKRVKPETNIYTNITNFISQHGTLFYTGDKKWDGRDYIGWLKEDSEKITIGIRINKGMEWVLVYGAKLDDAELKKYIDTVNSIRSKNEVKKKLQELLGDDVPNNFNNPIKAANQDKIEWHDGDNSRGANNLTLAEIVLKKDIIDPKGLKDSDKTDDKENEA